MAKLHDMEIDQYEHDSVTIDDLDLENELTRVPADLAYWNARYSQALKQHLEAKLEAHRVQAACRIRLRTQLEGRKGKGPTVDEVKDGAQVDEQAYEAELAEIAAEAERARLRGVCEAVSARKDALQTKAANLRREMESTPAKAREQRSLREDRLDEE